jgi:hypothetical protein
MIMMMIPRLFASCLSAIATLGFVVTPTLATTFDAAEVNDSSFVVVASPYGNNPTNYQLLILEQISQSRRCWRENNTTQTTIDPLLLNFDFTGICGRSVDGNGYSVRVDTQDLGMHYLLSIEKRQDELVLVANPSPTFGSEAPALEIGRTEGIADDFLKINLNPGWRLTRRTYQGRALGHIYLTGNSETLNVSIPPFSGSSNVGNSTVSAPAPRPRPAESAPRELIFTPSASPSPPTLPPLPSTQREETNSGEIPIIPVPPAPQQDERKIPTF